MLRYNLFTYITKMLFPKYNTAFFIARDFYNMSASECIEAQQHIFILNDALIESSAKLKNDNILLLQKAN